MHWSSMGCYLAVCVCEVFKQVPDEVSLLYINWWQPYFLQHVWVSGPMCVIIAE